MSMTRSAHDPYAIAAQEDRSAPRKMMTIPANLRPSGSKSFQTVVYDLSLSGFSATAINRLHKGNLCWLLLPGLESMEAEVVWWENGMVGCAFSKMLNPIIYENIMARWQDGN